MSAPPAAFADHDPGAWEPVPTRTLATWPAGTFAENLVVADDGTVLISLHSQDRIDRYDPRAGTVTPFAHPGAPVAGLALDANGTLWAAGGTIGQPAGRIWRIAADGTAEIWSAIDDAYFLNGCTFHPDGRTLLVCDSVGGRILAVDTHARDAWSVWLADPILAPVNAGMPGANGIKRHDGGVVISVTDRNLLLHAPITADGTPGPCRVLAEHLRADDIAVAPDGALLIATHPANSVLRLAPDGTRTTLAGPEQGAVGTTACVFAPAPPGQPAALYVTTNGGLWSPLDGVVQDARLLLLELAA